MRLKKNSFIAKIFTKGKKTARETHDAEVYHLDRDGFDFQAREVVKTLQENGFEAYIVGGGVRDQLLGLHPKDFDVATNARPEQVQKFFKRAIIIGKRFRIVHVYSGRYDYTEVATFRRDQAACLAGSLKSALKPARILARDNAYGTLEEDAFRRDFTVNALYYDPMHHHIIDFNHGIKDFEARILRLIGKPSIRLREDPVRILRALRISNKIGFAIDQATMKSIPKFIPLLSEVAGGRLFDEYQKLFLHGDAIKNFQVLESFGILPYFFPHLAVSLQNEKTRSLIMQALHNTDLRFAEGKTINPAFLITVFLWKTLKDRQFDLQKDHGKREAYFLAVREVIKAQTKVTNMPGYFSDFIEQVWGLQRQLELKNRNKALSVVSHPKFRAAFDFLLLRIGIAEVKEHVGQWWDQLYHLDAEKRVEFVS